MNTQRTPVFYMANLGAEVTRAISLREKGNMQSAQDSISRAFLIIEKVLSFEEMKPRTEEINILKSVLESLVSDNFSSRESENLKNYFYPFASRLV